MKIIRLSSENIKRLHAVEITPDGTLITIAGKNGAGKSSVLDSIAYALGGEKLVPSQPIRNGETQAKVVVDLGDLIVTRKFTREPIRKDEDKAAIPENIVGWTETRSTLTVTNKDGARYPSPQAVLDKLYGKLTFDPLQFARATAKEQHESLRRLVNLDTSGFDSTRKDASASRLILKRSYEIKTAQLLAMPTHKDAPDEELSIAEVSKDMFQAEELRKVAREAGQKVEKARSKAQGIADVVQLNELRIEELKRSLEHAQEQLATATSSLEKENVNVKNLITVEAEATAAIPDVSVIQQKLEAIEAANIKFRANKKYSEMAAEVDAIGHNVKLHDKMVDDAVAGKQAALEAVQYPVSGLSLGEDGVMLNGVPFDQASSSEQIKVSVAIGLALNPTLKVLLIRNGNMLDRDGLKAITEQATAQDAQLWVEWVAESKDGVTVMLEDGLII